MPRYFLHLSYNGKNYNGWQSQHNAPGVQDAIERCLSFKLGEQQRITGCGRTDTGVHARNFYAHFDTLCAHEVVLSDTFLHQLNICLPADIAIHKIHAVHSEAHARFDAISRTYHYYFHRQKQPFLTDTSFYVYGSLSIEMMQQCADILLEYTDFTSFSKLHSQTKTNICHLYEARIHTTAGGFYLRITADRFLRNMVRAIAGTLLEAGKGKIGPEQFRNIIEGKNRGLAGFSVPAHALFLEEVVYPEGLLLASAPQLV